MFLYLLITFVSEASVLGSKLSELQGSHAHVILAFDLKEHFCSDLHWQKWHKGNLACRE